MARRKRNRLPTDIVRAKITGLSHEGKGICHVDEKTVFVDGALQDETVSFTYTAKRKNIFEAVVEEVVEGVASRAEPACEFYAICGGCAMQHMQTGEQINFKQQVLIDNLQRLGHCQAEEILAPLTGPHWGYRRKARLGVRYVEKKQKLLVGFREKRSNFLAEINSCKVLHPAIGKRLDKLADLVLSLSEYKKIPQIEVSIGDESAAIIVRHLEVLNDDDIQRLNDFSEHYGIQVYTQASGPDSIIDLNGDPIAPSLHYHLPEFNIKHHFKATDFTQVNMIINRKMIDLALKLLDVQAGDKVLDLFCGLGNFTLPIATKAKEVVGVEGSEQMVQQAGENARLNQLDNVNFYACDLFKPIENQAWAGQEYDRILLDPARSGAKEIAEIIPKFKAHTIVYVSCNPSTLARDADILVNQHGYKLVKAGVMDMFPQTSHVESIALFKK